MKNKKENKIYLYTSLSILLAFVVWTIAVCFINVKAIGPNNSTVGFASINGLFHKATGFHEFLYNITDWFGLVPIFTVIGFAFFGIIQWVKRKRLSKVDYNLFILGGFYIVVIIAYIFFETVTINYRPVLINGILEKSYPSSTTLLVLCVMPTTIMQLNSRIKNTHIKKSVSFIITLFIVFMVMCRLLSGVHWLSDIIGGILLSTGLVTMYVYLINIKK